MVNTTDSKSAKTDGWEILQDTVVPGARPGRAFQRKTQWGTLAILEPATPKAPLRFAAIFPGYTGDALSHVAFIVRALDQGLGVVCVTPTWGNSTQRMLESTQELFKALHGGPLHPSDIHFLRAVSFGAYLSLEWLAQLERSVHKIALVTPCSGPQLTYAASQMKMDVRHDDAALTPPHLPENTQVRILPLKNDLIVPRTDPLFTRLARRTETLAIPNGDHFTAGEEPEASVQVARWFGRAGDAS